MKKVPKKVPKNVFSVVVGLVVVIVGVGLFLPSSYVVERDIVIQSGTGEIHVFVDDLTKWPEWGPWQEKDPSLVTTLGPVTAGVGAHQSWTGDSGTGALTLTASDPATGVEYDLSFEDGKYVYAAGFRYTPMTGATRVTWSMRGDVGFDLAARYFGLFSDALVGPMFREGLENLKTTVEGS